MDEFLAEQGITKLDILKIDAEGNDMQVIRGAGKALNTTVGVFTFEGNHNDGRHYSHTLGHPLLHSLMLSRSRIHALTHFLPHSLPHSHPPSPSLLCVSIHLLLYCTVVVLFSVRRQRRDVRQSHDRWFGCTGIFMLFHIQSRWVVVDVGGWGGG